MKVDAARQPVGCLEHRPAPPVRFIHFVRAEPGELHEGLSVALAEPVVDLPLDGDEPNVADAVTAKLDHGGSEEIERLGIPHLHLGDAP